MRLAVISDIHGNIEAFRRVLEDIGRQAVDEVVCLGDMIGYGPEPEAVVRLVRERSIPTILGNHEQGLVDRRPLSWFHPEPREALLATGRLLSAESLAWLSTLPRTLVRNGCRFVHGCPPASVRAYLFEAKDSHLARWFLKGTERLTFVGHSHDLELVAWDGSEVLRGPLPVGRTALDPKRAYIVNVGSVGQPRDGDNRAKYAIWDGEAGVVEIRAVEYDIAATVRRMKELGLPERYARRLW